MDVPFATGNQNESIIALKDGKMINFVVPYPMGFYAKTRCVQQMRSNGPIFAMSTSFCANPNATPHFASSSPNG
jgi:hypothetical protein